MGININFTINQKIWKMSLINNIKIIITIRTLKQLPYWAKFVFENLPGSGLVLNWFFEIFLSDSGDDFAFFEEFVASFGSSKFFGSKIYSVSLSFCSFDFSFVGLLQSFSSFDGFFGFSARHLRVFRILFLFLVLNFF